MQKLNKIILGFFIFSLLWIYKSWFTPGVITGGDLWYFFPSMFDNHTLIPSSFFFGANNGLGGSSILYSAVNLIMALPLTVGKIFNVPWELLERIFILFPFLIISTISVTALVRKIFPENKLYFLSPFIFLLNTYILMLVSGGLVLIGIAYGLIPLVILMFLRIQEKPKNTLLLSVIFGLILGLQTLLDMRVTYMTGWVMIIIYLANVLFTKKVIDLKVIIYGFIIPLLIDLLLNAFWIYPSIFIGSSAFKSLGDAYTSLESVRFFSFATFENSFSLLHPNWPENIFGKIYFQRPEFLILPLIAFSAIFFAKSKKEKYYISVFTLIALLGIFLGKGANDLFGQIYLLMFTYIPGFVLFRDPTKWYMLTAVSFSVLIPYVLFKITSYKKIFLLLPLIFIAYFALIIHPGYLGRLGGTLQTSSVPVEYKNFDRFMNSQKNFSRTLWIPHPSRFSYKSPNHPAVAADNYFEINTASAIVKKLNLKKLSADSIKYVVIPSDNRGEIFIKDRKYDHKEYLKTLSLVSQVKGLKMVNNFGGLQIFEIKDYAAKDHAILANSSSDGQFRIGMIISLFSILSVIIILIYLFIYENKI